MTGLGGQKRKSLNENIERNNRAKGLRNIY
jgi:hypothetical protein